MSDIIRHPIVIALIVGIATYFVMDYFNPNDTKKSKRSKKKKHSKNFFEEPREVNILTSVVVSMITWYYMKNKMTNDSGKSDLTVYPSKTLSLSSSEDTASYNLLGKGLQLPNGQVLPDIFHPIK